MKKIKNKQRKESVRNQKRERKKEKHEGQKEGKITKEDKRRVRNKRVAGRKEEAREY